MFNHIGVLISPDWYTSSFEIINPIEHLISLSRLLPNMTHKEWIELVFIFSRSFIYGYCIYWFYISLYISIKKERELLRKQSIRE